MAVGGYGRSELCLYSDIDLLLLHDGPVDEEAVRAILYPLWDSGLKIGHATRTVKATLSLRPGRPQHPLHVAQCPPGGRAARASRRTESGARPTAGRRSFESGGATGGRGAVGLGTGAVRAAGSRPQERPGWASHRCIVWTGTEGGPSFWERSRCCASSPGEFHGSRGPCSRFARPSMPFSTGSRPFCHRSPRPAWEPG